jgi:hypothetical protein
MESTCLFSTPDPVLKMALTPETGLWVSMTSSDLEFWDVKAVLQQERAARASSGARRAGHYPMARKSLSALTQQEPDYQPVPVLNAPHGRIEGLPAIVKHSFLDNRREVLVENSAKEVCGGVGVGVGGWRCGVSSRTRILCWPLWFKV